MLSHLVYLSGNPLSLEWGEPPNNFPHMHDLLVVFERRNTTGATDSCSSNFEKHLMA